MLIAASFSFCMLLYCVLKGIYTGYPLMLSLILFIIAAKKRGNSLREILDMVFSGVKKSAKVIEIILIIGAVTASWMAAGTVSSIVYYSIKAINPRYFLLCAFLISCGVSYLLGTVFGTVGTIGTALMVIARSGGINVEMAAAAVISGAFFGDRCSPVSSSANLVASLTETNIYENVRKMFKTSIPGLVITCLIYFAVSKNLNVSFQSIGIFKDIEVVFNIDIITFIPAVIILLFSILRINILISMGASILSAMAVGIFIQGWGFADMIKFIVFGFSINGVGNISKVIYGGGIIPMAKSAIIVLIAATFSGIFEGTGSLNNIKSFVMKFKTRSGLFAMTVLVSLITSAFGCTQTIAVMLTYQIIGEAYINSGMESSITAIDIENTAILLSALIPWNTASLVPAANLSVGYGFILYAFYIILVPLTNAIWIYIKDKNNRVYGKFLNRI